MAWQFFFPAKQSQFICANSTLCARTPQKQSTGFYRYVFFLFTVSPLFRCKDGGGGDFLFGYQNPISTGGATCIWLFFWNQFERPTLPRPSTLQPPDLASVASALWVSAALYSYLLICLMLLVFFYVDGLHSVLTWPSVQTRAHLLRLADDHLLFFSF